MATVTELRPEPLLRRRRQIRFSHTSPYDRRRKKASGFDVAAALEVNLDRFPTKDALWRLLANWLDAAKREGLAARRPDYAKALERALVIMSKAATVEHGIRALQDSRQ
jgi:hypothetical protein